MKNFTLITALSLCSFSWMSVSGSESLTVEVQAGGEVTLLSANISTYASIAFWFRVVNRSKVSCISVMFNSVETSYCQGFQNGKFEMRTNITTLFLTIKQVDLSDSGLYFCGFYANGRFNFNVIHLNVDGEPHDDGDSKCEEEPEEIGNLMTVILGTLTVFFMMAVIVLAVKIRQLQKAADEELHAERNQDLSREELNSAERRFLPKSIRSRNLASEREVETHVIYAASFRKTL